MLMISIVLANSKGSSENNLTSGKVFSRKEKIASELLNVFKKLISKKYNLLLINSGLIYRFASKLVITHNPKNIPYF